MKINATLVAICLLVGAGALAPTHTLAHGDVIPHSVDTSTLPPLGDSLRAENPYSGLPEAIKVGSSAYTQNCARCHGLDAVSGGMSPDLRHLDADCMELKNEAKKQACYKEVDAYFVSSVQQGKVRNGTVYMPPFEKVFNQEAIWAIKAYLETRREVE
ncbi:MAG: cytochrome c-550 PedF [Burkholderiaceae bacterium]|nr:cytochrome c-550 PedF [Burkholderiaceae bacterium]